MNDRADSESLKEETRTEFASVLEHLRKDHPEVVAGAGAVVAGTLGGAALMTAQLCGRRLVGLVPLGYERTSNGEGGAESLCSDASPSAR